MNILPKDNVTIIIPALNESATILAVVEKCLQVTNHVIVVDDGSRDCTGELVNDKFPCVNVLFHKHRRGKGRALLTALPYVKTPYVALQDADNEYNPHAILSMTETSSDMVVGQREMLMTDFYRQVSVCSFVANSIIARITGSPDVFSGQRVLRTDFMRGLNLRSNGFEIETEITIKAIACKADIRYIPVSYSPRTVAMGKKISAVDFFKILVTYARVSTICSLRKALTSVPAARYASPVCSPTSAVEANK